MSGKKKLELTWIGKEDRPQLEPRILLEQPEHSVPDQDGTSDNILIQGDNLLALRALEGRFAGRIKCIYIDPPYNTGSAFTHYDDGVEHSLWLSLMRDRLEVLRRLLASDGSIWVSIDDNECHYLKVLMDEVFGRPNFVSNVIWQKKYAPANDALWLSDSHDHILVYARDKSIWRPNKLPRTAEADAAYKNPDADDRGPWKAGDYTCAKTAAERPNLYYEITNPNTGEGIWPKRSRVWAYSQAEHERHKAEDMLWWGKDGLNRVPALKRFRSSLRAEGINAQTLWTWEEVGHTQDGRKEQITLLPTDPFPTPKPEKLLHRILHLATQPGDLVLDSFAGSGTTGAVAHKMGRKWIMIELAQHATTHIVPRLKQVIGGTDRGGVSGITKWSGGGGFRFFHLAPSLLEQDRWGRWVISSRYDAAMLAEAMCRHMGFNYAPSQNLGEYWKHGYSTENDFIFVTTQALTHEVLAALSHEVGPNQRLLICCKAFSAKADAFGNLTLKKIPQAILSTCEWGRDDYSLRIAEKAEATSAYHASEPLSTPQASRRGKKSARPEPMAADLFATPADAGEN